MDENRLYEKWEEARFVDRQNRFTLLLRKGKNLFHAYLPNTGRIEEYLTDGNVFFITPFRTQKFAYRVVSTYYQNSFVLLDTLGMNSLVEMFLRRGLLPQMDKIEHIQREISFRNMRVDFTLRQSSRGNFSLGNPSPGMSGSRQVLLEVKSCTFCHNGVALFPDAPSFRALHHMEQLHALGINGFDPVMMFMIPHRSAQRFMPNFHTDYDFSLRMLSEKRVRFIAVKVDLLDPVSVDLTSVKEIPIDRRQAHIHCTPSGSYMLVLKNPAPIRFEVGGLGPLFFKEGYYVYVGSALHSLDGRVRRHLKRKKTRFWHIDYITPGHMRVVKTFLFRRVDRIERALAKRLKEICIHSVDGFGASDSKEGSHLFYFAASPHRSRPFMDVVMDFKTFTE